MSFITFDTSGWRARLDDGFNEANVSSIAAALARTWREGAPGASVVVGYDGRHQGRPFAELVASILAGEGVGAQLSQEPCPLPALSWAIAHDEALAGGVLVGTADAPCEHSAIHVLGPDGSTVPTGFAEQVDLLAGIAEPMTVGAYGTRDVNTPYQEALAREFAPEAGYAGLTVVVDAMHGVGGPALMGALDHLGVRVRSLHTEVREDFGGLHPVAADPWADGCEELVQQSHADMGIVLDSVAMRSAVIDELGHLVSPQRMVPLVISHLVRNRRQRGRIVTTMSSSCSVRLMAQRLGLPFTPVPVGFSRMHAEMADGDVMLAGEEYGGISIPRHLAERDGIYAALLLVELVRQSGKPLSQLARELDDLIGHRDYGRRDIRLEVAKVQAFANVLQGVSPRELCGRQVVRTSHAEGLKVDFEDDSWLMLRPSREQPLMRVYAEAPTTRERDELMDEVSAIIRGGYKAYLQQ